MVTVARLSGKKNEAPEDVLFMRGVRPSTMIQDQKVIALIRKGMPRKEVAGVLFISYHQVCHSIQRMRARAVRAA